MAKRLTKLHPFQQKVDELYTKMEELGVTVSYSGGCLRFIDDATEEVYRLRDNDTGEMLQTFPTGTEFKLTFDE